MIEAVKDCKIEKVEGESHFNKYVVTLKDGLKIGVESCPKSNRVITIYPSLEHLNKLENLKR